ncbi:hypothetical protein [Haloglomus litoreum]|uniref:DUF7856 family protein n=1 Tax=Haloglomus litoreum TaxID=3034026 RepID=UPI0023E88688|nr:hypothetical protein [Haloglomus sp. DT116]
MTATAPGAADARARVRVRLGDGEWWGRALDLAARPDAPAIAPDALAAAVRDPDDDRVRCPAPDAAHEHVGLVDGRALARRRALAAVARALGHRASNRARIEELAARLADHDPPAVDLRAARERVADAGADVERRRERVATCRGRVQALREAGADTADAEAALETAQRALAEAETEHAAAEQALARAREQARAARDARERRLELEDALANARREARADLPDRVRERVTAAVVATPGSRATDLARADPVTARLALARVAPLAAPVVLAARPARRFPDAAAASDWLDAPVIRV